MRQEAWKTKASSEENACFAFNRFYDFELLSSVSIAFASKRSSNDHLIRFHDVTVSENAVLGGVFIN